MAYGYYQSAEHGGVQQFELPRELVCLLQRNIVMSYRPHRHNEAEEEYYSQKEVQRHISWFNRETGQNLALKDFSDGTTIASFVQHTLPKQGGSFSREEKIGNNNELITHLQGCGLQLVGVQAESLADSQTAALARLLWALRRHKGTGTGFPPQTPQHEISQLNTSADNSEAEKLKSLYTAGFIGEEEFKKRLREMEGADEGTHDSETCDCARSVCSYCMKLVKECCVDDHTEICTHTPAFCPVCNESIERASLHVHLEKCRVSHSIAPNAFDVLVCSWCNETIIDKHDHDQVCLEKVRECPMKQFGCSAEIPRKDYFAHITECRKKFTKTNFLANATCEFCGTVLHYSRPWDDKADNDAQLRRDHNESFGGHCCQFVCPMKTAGCDFTTTNQGKFIKHIEEDCSQNLIACRFCDTEMKRWEFFAHKCCDYAQILIPFKKLDLPGVVNFKYTC